MKLVVTSFVTVDGIVEAPGFDEHRSGRNAWALRVQNDEVSVEPGDTLAIDLTITLPDKLDKRSRYTGYAPMSTRTLTFIVVPD